MAGTVQFGGVSSASAPLQLSSGTLSLATDTANGVPTLDSDGNLEAVITQVETNTFNNITDLVLDSGEMAYATDTQQLQVGDGSTEGGFTIGLNYTDRDYPARWR